MKINTLPNYASAGFSIIEVLISTAVIGIMSALVFVNIGGYKTDASRAGQKFIFDLQQVQNMALNTASSVCAYGLRIESATQYRFYTTKPPGCDRLLYSYAYDNAYSEPILPAPISFTSEVRMGNFTVPFDIVFEPPEPMTYFYPAETSLPISFSLTDARGEITKEITINRLGRGEMK